MLNLDYFPILWKYAHIIMIHKTGKPAHEPASYRPISLLPIPGKIFEKILLKRIQDDHESTNLLPDYQFGFRQQMSALHQAHRIVNAIANSLEKKEFCNAVFLDISQAFDKVWHAGLLYKIKKKLDNKYYLILKSYLSDRNFSVRYNGSLSSYVSIKSGVPQGSVLGPYLYLLYTADMPETCNTTIAAFADDVAILATDNDPDISSRKVQEHLDQLNNWYKTWRMTLNNNKSVQVVFTTRINTCPTLTLNGNSIPTRQNVKYLGLHLDQRLTWKKHIEAKRKQLDMKVRKMYWLIGKRSKLTIQNKLLLYKIALKPIWTYGIQLWGCAKPSVINSIQRFQSKTLRLIANAPWYVTNQRIHEDLQIPFVSEVIQSTSTIYRGRLQGHSNELIENLYMQGPSNRRLKKTWPEDLPVETANE